MINEEIEEGELTSDEESTSFGLEKSSSNIVESGQLAEQNTNAGQNPYTEEDEDIIKLKMKALKSLLVKDSTSLKTLEDKKIRKSAKKVKKRPTKPNPLGDNYEPQDMDIDPPVTQCYPSPTQPMPDNQNLMQYFFNMFQFFCSQNNHSQMNAMNAFMPNQAGYANSFKRPKKKFKKIINRNLNKKKIFRPNIVAPPVLPSVHEAAKGAEEEVPLFTFNDVDERFLDTTTTSLDIDYRQLTQLELLNALDKSEEKELVENKSDQEEQSDNETEMMNLRKTLLDTLNQKRSLKKQQEQQQIDQDISLLKKKLAEHEKALFEADQNETNRTKNSQVVRQKTKIDPVIIRIGQDDSTDDETEKKSLRQSVGQFLSEAKQMAVESSLKRKNVESDLSEGELKKEEEKKDMIKSLRDRINLKSKMLFDLSKQSKDLEKAQVQKSSIVDFTKLKIVMLKEQLSASEKILQANQQSVVEIRNQRRAVDLKLTKLQNMRKAQQEMLQKLLNPVQNQKSAPTASKSPSPPPPTPPPPPPPPPPPSEQPKPSQQPSAPTPKPKAPINHFILNKMSLGSAVAQTAKTNESSKTPQLKSDLTRPNLNTSKQTDQKLESLLLSKNQNVDNLNIGLNENIVVNAKVVSSSCIKEVNKKSEEKKIQLENRHKLIELMEHLSRDYPHAYSESFDQWSYEFLSDVAPVSLCFENDHSDSSTKPASISIHNVLTTSNFCQFNQCDTSHSNLDSQTNQIHMLDNVEHYQSPLRVFRGYRFSSHFAQFSPFEEAYSKSYCHAIDYRRPFCPFDLHGSCKDSNCLYQHSNIMTMDNYQRTEHFLSYCPQLLELSSDTPTQREAVKKLKLYAKQFMNNNLNKMSIRDYFKHLYDHVVENLKLEPSYSTILSRLPILCLNNNRSIGVFDHFELENDSTDETKIGFNDQQLIRLNSIDGPNSPDTNELSSLLDLVYSANYCRILDSKLKKLFVNTELNLDYLRADNHYLVDQSEKIIAWVYYAKVSYANNFHIEKLISILSYGLESLPKCEILWLLYLRAYLNKKNSSNDYHEVCLLCMDNLVTHDLVLFILNTCPIEYLDMVFDKYENYLLNVQAGDLSAEFEQNSSADCFDRLSYYLFELIVFRTYVKLVQDNTAQEFLAKYLNNVTLMQKLEPNDLALLWLCLIHLEAFGYLPSWSSISSLNSSYLKSMESKWFWKMDSTRVHKRSFVRSIDFGYKNKIARSDEKMRRQFDIYLIPWKNGSKYSCSVERLQNLFHEALRSINIRCPINANTSLGQKQEVRLYSLPLLINLIKLEVSNKRYEIASKIVERLLKSSDAKIFKELWIILVFILKCQNMNDLMEQNLRLALQMFPNDPQLVHLLAQHYASMGQSDKAVSSIENFVQTLYSGKTNDSKYEANFLFNHCLGLEKSARLDQILGHNLCKLEISILYCYYLELKGVGYFNQMYIEQKYQRLIKSVKVNSHRSILWNGYFKFLSCLDANADGYSERVLGLVRKCAADLVASQALIPFNHVPRDLELSRSSLAGSFSIESGHGPDWLHFSTLDSESHHPPPTNSLTNSFFLNSIVDFLLRAFTRSQIEKNSLSRFLLELAPLHLELIKLHVSISHKVNGLHKSVQHFYDHLSMNHIDNEHLWLLCVKLCLDLNDYQQAVLIYHKAEQICSKGKKNLFELKRLKQHLFPSTNEHVI
ncbi:zinc finger C3H1 domain-containing [Brachionus plicatilis]|uniref:Zinc finger C3H1 domain-containing n=1 Tax=Brachionus plicatilis TaxID=10195 RepID=A0A3M7SS19_BRAPC|nr:zinc finger C3H1 domain-containing [Brachionus plicatilis]